MDSPNPSKIQSTVGTVLSIYTAPRQPGPNVRNEAQIVGGYTAGLLVASVLAALVYLVLWLRLVIQLVGRKGGEANGGTRQGKHDIRPVGPWLWPAALAYMFLYYIITGRQTHSWKP